MEQQGQVVIRLCRMARSAHPSQRGRGSPPKRVLLGTFRGGTLASAPHPPPPTLLRRPARGRHGSGGAHSLAARRPFPSPSRACGPGQRDVLEPQASAAFPGRADVNSFVAGGKEAFCLHLLSPGGPVAGWGPEAAGRRFGENLRRWAGARTPPLRTSAPERERPGRPGSSGPRVAFAAQIISLALGLGGCSPEHPRPGRGPGGGGPVGRRPRRPAGPGVCGEPGPTCSESEITLFNYTFPRPPSAIGAF